MVMQAGIGGEGSHVAAEQQTGEVQLSPLKTCLTEIGLQPMWVGQSRGLCQTQRCPSQPNSQQLAWQMPTSSLCGVIGDTENSRVIMYTCPCVQRSDSRAWAHAIQCGVAPRVYRLWNSMLAHVLWWGYYFQDGQQKLTEIHDHDLYEYHSQFCIREGDI